MNTKIISAALFFGILSAFAQDPAIIWQNTIGGSNTDFLQTPNPTSDGGYILAGYSLSNASGDKTENSNGGIDIWVVKIDATGNIIWQNTIGGNGDDYADVIQQTTDGGYIVFGNSDSNISGDKTENSRGGLDLWILKLDPSGNIVWQHTYGGAQPDFQCFGQQTADGGYIAGGYSDSDISGDKTDPTNGQRDFWVLKLDSLGDIEWQNSIGGSMVDTVLATKQTTDGGYIVGGFSNSPASGDKSEGNIGANDYWIVKLNPNGTIQWENTIGGTETELLRDLIQTADGGYLIGGYSRSNISGDKTENSLGDFDYWILKLDASGNITWQNTIGGSAIDYPRDVQQLMDGTYTIAGWSNSNISGDKTENSNGGYDFWLVHLDAVGMIIGQNSIGGAADESGTYILQEPDGNFMFFCSSDSNISGDKGDNNEGLDDYWIFKTTPAILGTPDHDNNLSLVVYPNPTEGEFTVEFEETSSEISVTVRNILGQLIVSERFENTNRVHLKIDDATGMYYVKVSSLEGHSETIKIIKN